MPIDPNQPVEGQATTQSVRDNEQATIDEFLRVDGELAVNAGRITQTELDILQNAADILANAGLISTNAGNISANAGDITTNKNSITDNETDILLRLLLTGGTISGALTVNGALTASDGTTVKTNQEFLRTADRLDITNVRTS